MTSNKVRGLSVAPEIALSNGAMRFCNAPDKAFSATRHRRRWVRTTKSVLNCFPKQPAAAVKPGRDDIQHAVTRSAAKTANECFMQKYPLN